MSEPTPSFDFNATPKEQRPIITIAAASALGLFVAGAFYTAWDQTASYNRLRAVQIGCEGEQNFYVNPQDSYAAIRQTVIDQIAEDTGVTPLDQQIDDSLRSPSGEYVKASGIASINEPLNVSYVVGPTKCADPSTTVANFTGTKRQN
mgnify:CR=1 FL=1